MQQVSVAGVEVAQSSTPLFSIEVESTVAQRLSDLSAKEKIPIKRLASQLLSQMLLFHRHEVNQIITQLRRNQKCRDS